MKRRQTRCPSLHCLALLRLRGMKEVYPPLSLLEQSESCKAGDTPGNKFSHRQGRGKDGASSARTEGPSILASSEKPPISAFFIAIVHVFIIWEDLHKIKKRISDTKAYPPVFRISSYSSSV